MSEPSWELLGGGGVLGPAGIDYVGDWVAGTTYQPGQIVRYAGVDYLAVNPSVGQVPPLASPYPQAMVCLYDNELAADGPGWDVPNISSAFAHLRLVFYMRSTVAAGVDYLALQFNGDTGANYDYQRHSSSGAAITGTGNLAANNIFGGYMPGANAAAGMFGMADILIPNYARTLGEKLLVDQNFYKEANTTAAMAMQNLGGYWRSTAAINRIRAFLGSANFKAGSRLSIYGLLAQGQSPPVTTLSPGGIGTSFPTSPANGELFTLVDSLTAPSYAWDFRYVASIADAYKWVFVGGAPWVKSENGTVTTTSAGYVVPTPGTGTVAAQQFIGPRVGLYQVTIHDDANANTGTIMYQGVRYNGGDVTASSPYGDAAKYLVRSGIVVGTLNLAGGIIQPVMAVGGGTLTVQNRQMSVLPVRLS